MRLIAALDECPFVSGVGCAPHSAFIARGILLLIVLTPPTPSTSPRSGQSHAHGQGRARGRRVRVGGGPLPGEGYSLGRVSLRTPHRREPGAGRGATLVIQVALPWASLSARPMRRAASRAVHKACVQCTCSVHTDTSRASTAHCCLCLCLNACRVSGDQRDTRLTLGPLRGVLSAAR